MENTKHKVDYKLLQKIDAINQRQIHFNMAE